MLVDPHTPHRDGGLDGGIDETFVPGPYPRDLAVTSVSIVAPHLLHLYIIEMHLLSVCSRVIFIVNTVGTRY